MGQCVGTSEFQYRLGRLAAAASDDRAAPRRTRSPRAARAILRGWPPDRATARRRLALLGRGSLLSVLELPAEPALSAPRRRAELHAARRGRHRAVDDRRYHDRARLGARSDCEDLGEQAAVDLRKLERVATGDSDLARAADRRADCASARLRSLRQSYRNRAETRPDARRRRHEPDDRPTSA